MDRKLAAHYSIGGILLTWKISISHQYFLTTIPDNDIEKMYA
ncbi:MAG: hypothetical protein ACLVBP_15540 [Ruminococcus sp.]